MAGQQYRVWPQKVDIGGPLGGVEMVRARMLLENGHVTTLGADQRVTGLGRTEAKGRGVDGLKTPLVTGGGAGGDLRGLSGAQRK